MMKVGKISWSFAPMRVNNNFNNIQSFSSNMKTFSFVASKSKFFSTLPEPKPFSFHERNEHRRNLEEIIPKNEGLDGLELSPQTPLPPTAQPLTEPAFAIVQIGGHQYKVSEGDVIMANKLIGTNIGDVVRFNKVLLIGTQTTTAIGKPIIPTACIVAEIQEQVKTKKYIILKKIRRKHSRKKMGHRQEMTIIKVKSINYDLNGELMKKE